MSSLPELSFKTETQKNADVVQIRDAILGEILRGDTVYVRETLSSIDNYNLLTLLYDKKRTMKRGGVFEFDSTSNLKKITLSRYMRRFLSYFEEYEHENGRKPDAFVAEQRLNELCYAEMESSKNRFVSKWHRIEREIKNIQAAYLSRKANVSAEKHLIADDELRDSLLRSQAQDFGLSKERDYVSELLRIFETGDLLERERKLDLFRWNNIDEINTFEYFTINAVLGVLQKACILDRWLSLNRDKGEQRFKEIVQGLKSYSTMVIQ
jgi:hypothetical protein